ncbi:hypothetical protein [Deinococcus petrolearius]|uniref:Bacterial type II secretion system protein E domain-containing protein n=1 Tax=Deinococcus petrolearius TaxID=1751295 RepID=A0ABW1DNT9_9DEIO
MPGTVREVDVVLRDMTTTEELNKVFTYLPDHLRPLIGYYLPHIEEIKLDVHKPLALRFGDTHVDYDYIVTPDDVGNVQSRAGGFKSNGRKGIPGTMHRVHKGLDGFRAADKITFRIAHLIRGLAAPFRELLAENLSIGVCGPPAAGKTTFIRDLALEDGERLGRGVDIVDTNNEIAGEGDTPHPEFETVRQWRVADPNDLAWVLEQPLRSGGTMKVYVDEVGYQKGDVQVVRTARFSGKPVTSSVHGESVSEAIWKYEIMPLFGVVVTDTGNLRQIGPPSFHKFIEIPRKNVFKVHHDLQRSVKDIVEGREPEVETVIYRTRFAS